MSGEALPWAQTWPSAEAIGGICILIIGCTLYGALDITMVFLPPPILDDFLLGGHLGLFCLRFAFMKATSLLFPKFPQYIGGYIAV